VIKITLLKTVTDKLKMDKLMSQKEAKKAHILERLKEHKISWQEASKRLGITTRQVRRLAKR
jgi:predicted ArsR family transcriptional regulator